MPSQTDRKISVKPDRRFAILLAGLVGLLVAAGIFAKPAVRRIRAVRAGEFLAAATNALAAKDMGVFVGNLRAANELIPDDPRVLRLNAQHFSRYGHSDGLLYWHQLLQSGQATREDQLAYAQLALQSDRTDLARTLLKPLHYGNPMDAPVLVLLSELFEREGDLPRATSAALDAITRDPRNARAELRLAKLELAGGTPAQRQAARARLYALVSGTNSLRAEAAMSLLIDGTPEAPEANLIGRLLQQQPARTFGERLAQALADLRRPPRNVEAIIAGLPTRPGQELSPLERGFAAERFGAAGEFEAVLRLVPETVALTNRHFAVFRLGAQASVRDLEGMERLLKHPGQPLPPSFTATFKATLAALANRTNETSILWKSALAESASNPTALRALALQAERAAAYDVAVRSWEELMANAEIAPFAARQLLRIAKLANDPRAAYVALRRLHELDHDRPELRLPLAYYQALLDLEPAVTERLLADARESPADRELFALASALFQLRKNDPETAAALLESGAIQWTDAPTSWRVVRIAATGRSGNGRLAREYAQTLERARLSAAEYALVEPWLPATRVP